MASLDTVAQYVTSARTLLQDSTVPYRYSDADLVEALNLAMYEARRLRPDLFLGRANAVPSYTTNDGTVVVFDQQYRNAVVYYIVGRAQLRDEEDTQDTRAVALIGKFTSQLLTLT